MRIICLNVWGGRLLDELVTFLKHERKATDVFCFQEVFSSPRSERREEYVTDLYERFDTILEEHEGFFAPMLDGQGFDGPVDFELRCGNAIFSRSEVLSHAMREVYPGGDADPGDWPRNVHAVGLEDVVIANFHGLVHHGPVKGDCPERFEQSKNVKEFLSRYEKPVVLCGDFNMRSDTDCLAMLEEELGNWVTRADIEDTRTSYFDYPIRESDYVLASSELSGDVEKLDDEVSDHAPLAVRLDL